MWSMSVHSDSSILLCYTHLGCIPGLQHSTIARLGVWDQDLGLSLDYVDTLLLAHFN